MPVSLSRLFVEASEVSKDADAVLNALESLLKILVQDLKSRNSRPYVIIDPKKCKELVVFGDIHGDLQTFIRLSNASNLDEVLSKGGYVIFLGDYVDRGPYQIETLVLLSMIKKYYGEKVILLRGNHEPPEWLPPYPHDFPYRLAERFGTNKAKEIYGVSQAIFEQLPLMTLLEGQALFVHGGPPITRSAYAKTPEELLSIDGDRVSIEEILWSDPDEIESEWKPSPRGAGKLFGKKVTERVLGILNIRMIVRAHEPCNYGFKFNHDGKVLTLFSLRGYPYFNVDAAILKIRPSEDPEWCIFPKVINYIITASGQKPSYNTLRF